MLAEAALSSSTSICHPHVDRLRYGSNYSTTLVASAGCFPAAISSRMDTDAALSTDWRRSTENS